MLEHEIAGGRLADRRHQRRPVDGALAEIGPAVLVPVLARRGEMHDDPLVFAFKDRASLLAGLLFAAAMLVGTIAW